VFIQSQRGRRDTPNSMGAERRRAEAKPGAKHTRCEAKHKQTRATRDTPTLDRRVSEVAERDGRKGLPAGNKTRCNRTDTAQSKAPQRKAKPNKKTQTRTRGAK
jgi:hypothetical protein